VEEGVWEVKQVEEGVWEVKQMEERVWEVKQVEGVWEMKWRRALVALPTFATV